MIELLALIFMPTLTNINQVRYQNDHCYKSDKSQFETIQIVARKNGNYWYKIIGYPEGQLFANDIDTVEEVYNKEVECP